MGNSHKVIERIRSRSRYIFLRTTFMVGFPGETDRIFSKLCAFIKEAQFDHMGAFVFSPEEGTSAARLAKRVDRKIARQRREEIMAIQADISTSKNKQWVGKVQPVLVEGVSDETELLLKGRTAGMAPDVDGKVYINKGQCNVGDILPVRFHQSHIYDLVGEIV